MNGLILSHGWGLTPNFFTPLLSEFSDFKILFWDRGFYKEAHCPEPLEGEWIGIGHSQGLSHLINSKIPFKGLIGLNPFTHFLGKTTHSQSKRQAILKAFQNNFKKSPLKTITEFQKMCGQNPIMRKPNYEKLANDLEKLSTRSILSPNCPLKIFGTQDDPIVPPELILDNFEGCPVDILPKGGHGLPQPLFYLTSQIRSFIQCL